MKRKTASKVARRGIAFAAVGLSLSAAPAFADESAFPDKYGYALTGLGAGGDETALVFTNTAYTAESPMTWTLPDGVKEIRYLVVGGGGGGGACAGNWYTAGGGGGAGSVLASTVPVEKGSALSVIVGAGGAGAQYANNAARSKGVNGSGSSLGIGDDVTVSSAGGGGGGSAHNTAGASGGCGGGGSYNGAAGTGTSGYNGGKGGSPKAAASGSGGGGGGAGAKGGDGASASPYIGGAGGSGVESDIAGTSAYYAGGGSGGNGGKSTSAAVAGGAGGGGTGGSSAVKNGGKATYYGGGGGGGYNGGHGGAGYQGVVVVRYRVMAANEALVPTIASKPYNGETQTADVTDGEGYYVVANAGGVNASDYTVTLALSNGWHWTGGSTADTNLTFKITKIDNSWTTQPSLSKTAWTLEETPATVDAGAATDGEVVVTYDAGAAEMPTDLGSHTAVFTVAASQNYNELQKTIPYTVNKNVNSWTTTPSITPTAWELDQESGVVTNGVARFGGEATITYDGSATEMPTTIGQHTAVFTVAEGETYGGISTTVSYTVSKNTNVWTTEPALSKTTWIFDQEPATLTPGVAKYGDCELTWDGDPEIATMPTGIGDHTASFVVTGTVTYTALEKEIAYSVTKRVNGWTSEPVVPKSYDIEDLKADFTAPTSTYGEVYRYFDGDVENTEPPTDLGNHTVTYKVDEGDEYQGYEKTYSFAVTYKAITDWADPSKVYGYRIPRLGEGNEVALVFTNTAFTAENPMAYRLPYDVTEVSYLVVGGGASGGATYNANSAGGGGAGGVVTNVAYAVEPGAALQIVVGAGGATSSGYGKDGKPSTLMINEAEFVALKGGAGGYGSGNASQRNGAGGTGYACGGGAGSSAGAGSGDGGYGTQGGNGADRPGGYWMGGGAGGAGGSAVRYERIGGAGVAVTIFGETLTIAKGGDGSLNIDTKPSSGAVWGCGGDGKCGNNGYSSGAGHQGVVVVRYVEDPTAVTVPYIASKDYTGNPQVADVPASDKYTVTANLGGTDVGAYVVTLTLADGYRWDGGNAQPTNLVFAITPAQNVWTVEPSISKDYWLTTDEPGVLTNGETKFGDVTRVIVKNGGTSEPFVTLPTEAGVYVITNIAPVATDNYLAPEVLEKTVSFTIFGASETPNFTVVRNGDVAVGEAEGVVTAAVPYRVSCEVESAKLVNVYALVAQEGSDETNEVTLAESVALDATGYGLLDDLPPAQSYWVSLYGKGVEDGKSSPTTDVVRVTTPGPATGLTASATFSNDPKEFVITGSVTPGLGTTTVYLRWSLNSNDLDQLATYTFAYGESGAFAKNIAYEAFSDWLYWDVAVSNNYVSGTYGELAWSDAKAAKTVTRADTSTTTYTWTGAGADNGWANPDNWSPSKSPCYGIPDGEKARVKFNAGATVNLQGQNITVDKSDLAGNVDTFVLPVNDTLTLTNGTIAIPTKRIKKNCTLCLKDGGKVTGIYGNNTIFGQDLGYGTLWLAGDATFDGDINTYVYSPSLAAVGNTVLATGTNNVVTGYLHNQGGRLLIRVEDGDLYVSSSLMVQTTGYGVDVAVSNGTISCSSLAVYTGVTVDTAPRTFSVFIPGNGLAAAPIEIRTASALGAKAKIVLTCDQSFVGGKVPLISGVSSIPDALVANTTVPDGFTVTYTIEDGVLYARLRHDGFIFFVK